MKKILFASLFLPSLAWSSFQPVTGSTINIQGSAASGATTIGNPVQIGVKVTSTTIPTAVIDGQEIYQAGTNIGQQLVTGIPWGLISSTYSATMSSSTYVGASLGSVLVSSAGASTYAYLCGCIFTNTTATNGAVIITSPPDSTTNRLTIGIPANYIPTGIWGGCTNPFFRSGSNSTIGIVQNIATSNQAVFMSCIYYKGP